MLSVSFSKWETTKTSLTLFVCLFPSTSSITSSLPTKTVASEAILLCQFLWSVVLESYRDDCEYSQLTIDFETILLSTEQLRELVTRLGWYVSWHRWIRVVGSPPSCRTTYPVSYLSSSLALLVSKAWFDVLLISVLYSHCYPDTCC